jgi:peptidoglycan-associated lipoprotein
MLKAMYSFFVVGAFLLLVTGCRHNTQIAKTNPPAATVPPLAPAANIAVIPQVVQRGQTAQLTWNTQNAFNVTIDGLGTVAASGSRQITPDESTTYHLIAKGDSGSAEANARLTVTLPEKKVAELTDEQLFAQNVKDIFFNYDNANIRADEQSIVNADAQFLAVHPDWQLVLEGHCDERGSEEYNLALGDSRAKQVMDALVRQGISAARVKLISFGKERPFCTTAENESCWSQNRRAHFVLHRKESSSLLR